MELWIPITIFAAFMQNLRSVLQKHLTAKLSTSGATFTRFVFGVPIAILYLAAVVTLTDAPLPTITPRFLFFVVSIGLSQILATALLVYLFSFRNFAVGTAFSKTEAIQAALFGIVVLGEGISAAAAAAIMISLVGVIMLSVTKPTGSIWTIFRHCFEWPALIGIASGALFGVAAISVRAASFSLESGDFVMRAALTLACVTIFQTIIMAAYMRLREPGQITAVFQNARIGSLVGLCGVIASAGWFTAMTLENAAYVRALGQIELVFTFAATYFFFHERATRNELAGITFIVIGILVLLLAR